MGKYYLNALAVLVVAVVAAMGWSAETETKQPESKKFFDRLKGSSPLHLQLVMRKHDEVFKMLPAFEDIDAIEPVCGGTPLTVPTRDDTSNAYDIVQAMILKYGADPTRNRP